MRKHWIGAYLLLAGALLGPGLNRAQAQWDVSGYPSTPSPLPIGNDRPDEGGLYFGVQFLYMVSNVNVGNQLLAVRGFVDSDGSITGVPGSFIGSKRQALDTNSFGQMTWQPGIEIVAGYKLANGDAVSISYINLVEAKYSTSAGPIPVDFNTGTGGADSFLFSPVYNFNPQFSGPQNKLAPGVGSGGSPYGIWNGASDEVATYIERFTNWDITYRSPVLETDYSRSYALTGGRFAWIYERFAWNTISTDNNGIAGPQDQALYTNIMSQRMYGPFVGIGNDVWLGNKFSVTAEATGAILYAIAVEKAAYTLGDDSIRVKHAQDQFTLVPNVNANINLNWFPIENVQIRTGYNLWTYFNSMYMNQPVGFNGGNPDPSYNHRPIRYFQGFNAGFSINF